MMKVPVTSILTKTLDIVHDGVETLQVVDDGIKQLKEKPIDTILTKTTGSVKDTVTHKLEPLHDSNTDTDNNDNNDDDVEPKLTMVWKATELIDMVRQDSILGKVVKPLHEKVEAAKQTAAGSILTDLVVSGSKFAQDVKPAKVVEVVDDNTQPNQASSILTKSMEFIAAIKENPSEALLAAPVVVAENIISKQMQNSDKTQQKATRSILSTVPDLEEAVMQAAREDPVELLCSKTMRLATSFVESNPDKSNELVSTVKEKPNTKTAMDIVAAKVINQGPPESSLQGMLESAIQLQSVPLANDGAKTPMHKTNNSAAVNLTDTSNVDPTCATLALSGSMNKMQIVDFEESLPK